MIPAIRAHPLGDSAITLSLGTTRSKELLARVHALAGALARLRLDNVHDIVPAYLAVTVFYDSASVSYEEMTRLLVAAAGTAVDSSMQADEIREHEIQVQYDGPDLPEVAGRTGLSVDEVVLTHSSRSYTVDLLGFVPGFAYLSELPPSLHLPRRPQPRPRVAAGSVAIAGSHTGIYPLDTPGGWHLLGRTQTPLFDPMRSPPALFRPGDLVRFVPA
jgi:KipI family sensor histidine kinase inhibitor